LTSSCLQRPRRLVGDSSVSDDHGSGPLRKVISRLRRGVRPKTRNLVRMVEQPGSVQGSEAVRAGRKGRGNATACDACHWTLPAIADIPARQRSLLQAIANRGLHRRARSL
jgi:hypothetical protein